MSLSIVGMGKSIMTSSLIHTSRVVDPSESPDDTGKSAKRRVQGALNFSKNPSRQASTSKPTATLIVAPLTLLSQWKSELERSSKKGTLKAYIYHGTARADLEALVNCEEDHVINVVITSYGTLSSEHAKYVRGGASSFYDGKCTWFPHWANETMKFNLWQWIGFASCWTKVSSAIS